MLVDVDVESMCSRGGVDVGSMWGRRRVEWGPCAVDVRSIIIYKVERLVTPPSPIFYKR